MKNITQPTLDFSILLPVCHGGKFLYQSLHSLRDIDFPYHRFEVLVAGSIGDEQSKNILESEAALTAYPARYIECPDMNRAGLLNKACSAAKGNTLAFADDDCIFFPDWLTKLEHVLKLENNIGVIGGEENFLGDTSSFDLALDYVLNSFLGTGGVRKGRGSRIGKYYPKLWNMAIPRDVAINVALTEERDVLHIFNESLDVHEDVDLADRIERSGKRVIFAPEVRIGHYRDTTFKSFFLRNMAMARTCKRLRVHQIPHIMLSIFISSIAVLAIFSLIFSPLRSVIGIVMGIYTAVLLVGAIGGFKRTRRWQMLVMIPVLLSSLHFARGLGYLFPWKNQKSAII
jgi:cellulose synthase/poly-beta-1,6-N-acetylglucosamine synthase-like glycosyltransferase